MDAMNLPVKSKTKFSDLLKAVKADFPVIKFEASELFRWSDETQTIYFNRDAEYPLWSLLHELGHVECKHNVYNSDTSLIRIELEAWESAKKFGLIYGVKIDEEHIQDCMDSYRSWQHKRSTCPSCSLTGLEKRNGKYHCINCMAGWKVSEDRFCRVYRRSV